MKKNTKPFSTQYPYLDYWINSWGFITMGNNENFPYGGFFKLIDMGGVVFECDKAAGETLDTLFQKAEKYLREVESKRFDKETIEALEAEYRELGL
jgi:hypothetical protein